MKNVLFGSIVLGFFAGTIAISFYCFTNAQTLTWLKIGAAEFRFDQKDGELIPSAPDADGDPTPALRSATSSDAHPSLPVTSGTPMSESNGRFLNHPNAYHPNTNAQNDDQPLVIPHRP